MSNSAAKRKAKDKAYYIKSAKQAKKWEHELGPGVCGFLITSNNREKESIREAYNLLNEFADELYGKSGANSEAVGDPQTEEAGDSEGVLEAGKDEASEPKKLKTEDEEEIEDELGQELANLKKEGASKEWRFQSMTTGVKSCSFIKTTLEKPFELMNAIMKDLEEKRQQKTRFLLRMLPILITCKPTPEVIVDSAKPIVDQHLAGFKSFSILYKVRNNNVKREEVIEPLANYIKSKFSDITVNLDTPEVCVVIEVIRKTCCIGIVENYHGRAKYNLLELAQKPKQMNENK